MFGRLLRQHSQNRAVSALATMRHIRWKLSFIRHDSCQHHNHIAIVGSGPSAYYTAKYILERDEDSRVDMFERMPVPYGLVRFGVAPDHPEVKTVTNTFQQVAQSSRYRFFGNVQVGHKYSPGQDCFDPINVDSNAPLCNVSLQSLRKAYSAVVLAYGASSDNKLGIPGEATSGVIPARQFVNWYNGHPEYNRLSACGDVDLSTVRNVVIIGQGNVALDCARVLTKSCDELAWTDIADHALHALRRSSVRRVTVVGRRGHMQAAFTIKEFRELTRLFGVRVVIDGKELTMGKTEASLEELKDNRPKKRIVDLIEKTAGREIHNDKDDEERILEFRFLLSPVEIVGGGCVGSSEAQYQQAASQGSLDRATSVLFRRNKLEGPAGAQRAVPTDETVEIPCDLVLSSVGYRCESIDDELPFDQRSGTVPHVNGRVQWRQSGTGKDRGHVDDPLTNSPDSKDDLKRGGGAGARTEDGNVYVTGWLKRGATGIVASNVPDAKETATSVLEDIKSKSLTSSQNKLLPNRQDVKKHSDADAGPEAAAIVDSDAKECSWEPLENLPETDTISAHAVSWEQYMNIAREEERRGAASSPRRELVKITDRTELLAVAKAAATVRSSA